MTPPSPSPMATPLSPGPGPGRNGVIVRMYGVPCCRECGVCLLACASLDSSACECCAGDCASVGIMLVRLCVLVMCAGNRVIYNPASVLVPRRLSSLQKLGL